jgi:hypothetical protein
MYDVPTHAKLSKELKSPTILGSAVAMMDVSKLASMVAVAKAPNTMMSLVWVKPGTEDSFAIRFTVLLFASYK